MMSLEKLGEFVKHEGKEYGFRFGLGKPSAELAKIIHELAKGVESGKFSIQNITYSQEAGVDDYLINVLSFRYAEKESSNG